MEKILGLLIFFFLTLSLNRINLAQEQTHFEKFAKVQAIFNSKCHYLSQF